MKDSEFSKTEAKPVVTITRIITLILVTLGGSGGYLARDDVLPVAKRLMHNAYGTEHFISVYDPCDPVLQHLSEPSEEWWEAHGKSNKSVLLYNLALARSQRGDMRNAIINLNTRLAITEERNKRLWKVLGREPDPGPE